MNIKETGIWKFLRNLKYKKINKLRYKKAKNLPMDRYEDFICDLYNAKMKSMHFAEGETMDFANPKTFTQKQQWLNLYDDNIKKSLLTDKYEVRSFIKEKIGDEYLVPLIHIDGKDVFDSVKEINFDKLPNKFVIKCTHGSHMNVIVSDKSKLSKSDKRKILKQLAMWLKTDYTFVVGLELQYHQIKPRMIIEEYIAIDNDLPDYKFFCFSGEPKFMWVDTNRFSGHKRTVFDLDFNKEKFSFDFLDDVGDITKPTNFNKMIDLAKELSDKSIPLVRVDFYEANGKLYFGEMTFSSHAGLVPPRPIEYNKILGDLITLDLSRRDNNFKYRKR